MYYTEWNKRKINMPKSWPVAHSNDFSNIQNKQLVYTSTSEGCGILENIYCNANEKQIIHPVDTQ